MQQKYFIVHIKETRQVNVADYDADCHKNTFIQCPVKLI